MESRIDYAKAAPGVRTAMWGLEEYGTAPQSDQRLERIQGRGSPVRPGDQNHAPTIYAYSSLDALLKGEVAGGAKANLPGVSGKPVTERPR